MKRVFLQCIVCIAVCVLCVTAPFTADATDTTWKVYLNYTNPSNLILTSVLPEGQTFKFSATQCSGVPSSSSELVNALDGVSVIVQQSPFSAPATYSIVLHTSGDSFAKSGAIPLFFNATFEAYVGGSQQDARFPTGSPLVLTLPRACLTSLLSAAGMGLGQNMTYVFEQGGQFTKDGITTQDGSTALVARMNRLGRVMGGIGTQFGLPASTAADTWLKIKLLFR